MLEKADTENIIKVLIPKVEESIKALIDGTFKKKLPQIRDTLSSELWDKAVEQIGLVTGLPPAIIGQLQHFDDVVKGKSSELDQLMKTLQEFGDRLKGIDVHKTVVMSYAQLQTEKRKAGRAWFIVGILIGFLGGVVAALQMTGQI